MKDEVYIVVLCSFDPLLNLIGIYATSTLRRALILALIVKRTSTDLERLSRVPLLQRKPPRRTLRSSTPHSPPHFRLRQSLYTLVLTGRWFLDCLRWIVHG